MEPAAAPTWDTMQIISDLLNLNYSTHTILHVFAAFPVLCYYPFFGHVGYFCDVATYLNIFFVLWAWLSQMVTTRGGLETPLSSLGMMLSVQFSVLLLVASTDTRESRSQKEFDRELEYFDGLLFWSTWVVLGLWGWLWTFPIFYSQPIVVRVLAAFAFFCGHCQMLRPGIRLRTGKIMLRYLKAFVVTCRRQQPWEKVESRGESDEDWFWANFVSLGSLAFLVVLVGVVATGIATAWV